MTDEEYEVILRLLKDEFNVPVAQRTRVQKNAIIKFWRLKTDLSLDVGDEKILFQGWKVLRKNDLKHVIARTFKAGKSGGYKKLRARTADGYTGMSNKNIIKVTSTDFKYKRFTARFTDKAPPRKISTRKVRKFKHNK